MTSMDEVLHLICLLAVLRSHPYCPYHCKGQNRPRL